MHEKFEKLIVESTLPPEIVVDFLSLCVGGSNLGNKKIRSRRFTFDLSFADGSITIVLEPEETDLETDDDLIGPVSMLLGAKVLGASARLASTWSGKLPKEGFYSKFLPTSRLLLDRRQPLESQTVLTLDDMFEVNKALVGESRPASQLMDDAEFRRLFPGVQSKWGEFGFLRHRSGVEIKTSWHDKEFIYSHSYEAPNPIEDLLIEWTKTIGIELEEEFGRRFRRAKWNLSKMLSKVPPGHQKRVYDWVISSTFDIEEFQDTRGGFPIPETFECEFANCILTLDRNMNFELVEV